MNAIEARLAHLEGAYEQIDRRLGAIEGRLDGIGGRFSTLEGRFEVRFGDLDRKMDSVFFRLVTLMLGSWVTLMLGIVEILLARR